MNTIKKWLSTCIIALLVFSLSVLGACSPQCGIYFSVTDWAVALIEEYYYEDVSEESVREAGLENLSGNVLDIYSGYYTAAEYAQIMASNEGSRIGIGISYQYIPPEYGLSFGSGVYVVSVLGNSPAERAGLRAGMFITGARTAEGEETAISANNDLSSFIGARGEGEEFTLVTDRGEFTLSRQEYTMSYCYMATADRVWKINYSASGTMSINYGQTDEYSFLPEGAAIIGLSQFYGNAAAEMAELLRIFNDVGCTSLILDLRNNGGGLVDVMQRLAHLFTADLDESSDIAMTAQFKKEKYNSRYSVISFTQDSSCFLPAGTPVTVLANNGTASASEALIGVLVSNGVIDYGDIYVSDFSQAYLAASGMEQKNCRTYGKGIMQSTFEYISGEALKLTVARILWPNGRCIHEVGVGVDDGCKTSPAEWSVTYADEELRYVCSQLSQEYAEEAPQAA